jgi:hypothetical protein
MITAAILILFVLAVGYAVQRHQSRQQPSYPRPLLFGSASFEDRDIARIAHDLQR